MRTTEVLTRLCEELQLNCGDTLAAARACGVSLIFVNQWRKDDPDADAQIQEAINCGTQGLVSEAIRRAVTGIPKGVYYKGALVNTETEYSDTLLTTLLKARVDEFRQDAAPPPSVTVNIANLMPRASTYEEWLAMKDSTLKITAPDNSNVIDQVPEAMTSAPTASEYIEAEFEPSFKGISL